ncbi:MAG: hypothetical protein ACLFUV_02515 [Methanomassiliicoccales archaeon]
MSEFTRPWFIVLIAVVFPLMLLASSVYLQSNICTILAVFIWIGIAVTMLYLPHTEEG